MSGRGERAREREREEEEGRWRQSERERKKGRGGGGGRLVHNFCACQLVSAVHPIERERNSMVYPTSDSD